MPLYCSIIIGVVQPLNLPWFPATQGHMLVPYFTSNLPPSLLPLLVFSPARTPQQLQNLCPLYTRERPPFSSARTKIYTPILRCTYSPLRSIPSVCSAPGSLSAPVPYSPLMYNSKTSGDLVAQGLWQVGSCRTCDPEMLSSERKPSFLRKLSQISPSAVRIHVQNLPSTASYYSLCWSLLGNHRVDLFPSARLQVSAGPLLESSL